MPTAIAPQVSVRRVLAQVLAQRSVLLGPAAAAATAAASIASRPRLRVHGETGAHHLLLELRPPAAPPALAMASTADAAAAREVATLVQSPAAQRALMERIKRRLRRSGLRTEIMAHQDGSGAWTWLYWLGRRDGVGLRGLAFGWWVQCTGLRPF